MTTDDLPVNFCARRSWGATNHDEQRFVGPLRLGKPLRKVVVDPAVLLGQPAIFGLVVPVSGESGTLTGKKQPLACQHGNADTEP